MLFISTRNPKIVCDFQTATLNAIAQNNNGMFVPVFFPHLTFEEIQKLSNKSYKEILFHIMLYICEQTIGEKHLEQIINDAFKDFNRGFGGNKLTMIKENTNDNIFTTQKYSDNMKIANFTHGPTGCSKDYGYCLAAGLINYFAKKEGKIRSIVDISDGLTASTTAWAVKNKEFINCFIILKAGKDKSFKALISQAHRNSNNINYITVNSNQSFINEIRHSVYNNTSFREIINMSFVKAHNFSCILAYLPAFFKMYKECNYHNFCVSIPSNNLTLAMSALYAKMIGIPIKKIILATENNGFLFQIEQNMVFKKQQDIDDNTSAFDANIPINLERILFYLCNSNQLSVKRIMEEIEINGSYKINNALFKRFCKEEYFISPNNSQFEIKKAIYSLITNKNIYAEQHLALAQICANNALEKITADIGNSDIFLFNTLDYRRNIEFVVSSIGYELNGIEYPWNEQDVATFSKSEISPDITEILRYVSSKLEDTTKATNVKQ